MGSMRARLFLLWLMLAASAAVVGFVLIEFYRQSANSQVARAEERVGRACRDIADRYAFVMAGWRGSAADIDATLRQRLTELLQPALARAPGVEGGIWQATAGSLAYAFPTYEGTGPKTDLPVAELGSIREVNAAAASSDRPDTLRRTSRSQALVLHACPLPGPLEAATGWTMTRVFTGEGAAYSQLLIGLAVIAVTVIGSAVWLGRVLLGWSRKLSRLEAALATRERAGDLPALLPTGERELDRLVDALNAAGTRISDERRRATAAERLAAVGRLAAGIAHEIRNPIAAMRLKAENALVADDARRTSALSAILTQIGRLDALLHDLLAMTQRRDPALADADLDRFLRDTVDPHRELARAKGVRVGVGPVPAAPVPPKFDIDQVRRAVDNLLLNAIHATPPGGSVEVGAAETGGRLHLRVTDTGTGVPPEIHAQLFEPFVGTRADGTGLGLAIVREIARAHGGDARLVANAPGATFEIELPWRPS